MFQCSSGLFCSIWAKSGADDELHNLLTCVALPLVKTNTYQHPPNNLPTSTFSPHFAHCQLALELCQDSHQLISTSSPQHAHVSFCPHFIHRQIVDFCVGNLREKCWPVDNLRGINWHICWDYVGMGIILIICGKYVGRSLIFCPLIPHILYILLLVSSTVRVYADSMPSLD